MSEKSIKIQPLEGLDILVDGIQFNLLCEYESNYPKDKGKQNPTTGVYVKDDGEEALVLIGKDHAVADLFSVKPDKVCDLFHYIEATMADKQIGLDVIECEGMKRYLDLAVQNGGKYPHIRNSVDDTKSSGFFHTISNLFTQKSLNQSLKNKVQSHMVSVDFDSGVTYGVSLNSQEKREDSLVSTEKRLSLDEKVKNAESQKTNFLNTRDPKTKEPAR